MLASSREIGIELFSPMETRTTVPGRRSLKAQYLDCLKARSPFTFRRTVQALLRLGVRRELLLAWAVAAGHDRKYVAKLLSECLTALGIRQRRPGGGRRTAPAALVLLAFARQLFPQTARQNLYAAWRAARGPAGARLQARGLRVIPLAELYLPAIARFARRLAQARNSSARKHRLCR